jgi:hypothetical protein
MNTVLLPHNIKLIYDTFINKKKERLDIILEPLQCILQISLLKFCPVGTKITISNNLLQLQLPTYTQGIIRWYNNDNREDLFYLFNACKRFGIFYKHLKENKLVFNTNDDEIIETNLYDTLIYCCKEGLDKLIMTYSNIDRISLHHTLELYKLILDNDEEQLINNQNKKPQERNIENIFINIKDIYSNEEINIIHNSLNLLLNNENSDCSDYIKGLNTMLKPTYSKIKKWINENIIF